MMWKVDALFGHHNLKPGNEVKQKFLSLIFTYTTID